ncbi:molybdopterin-dependent oxidoreductase [uncultured Cohaesibacter sp.]|uniref:molybdopterin-dependent oxidoreductase n=1 Tax=uncultured Cohaesibacter sp. TaxID=1002546 RepID=UPI0029C8584D|nr:molybdopterin-dependent oxidoreductase [uncultured Cohaesibacter sp.]
MNRLAMIKQRFARFLATLLLFMAGFVPISAPVQSLAQSNTQHGEQSIAHPKGDVILTITGQISNFNAPGEARFDLDMIKALGTRMLTSRTCCSTSASDWKGVLMRDLLEAVGAKGETLTVTGLDEYQVDVPIDDYRDFDVILAFEENGEELSIRTRGPLRLIYPHDHHTELHDPKYAARYIWQIRKMHVK